MAPQRGTRIGLEFATTRPPSPRLRRGTFVRESERKVVGLGRLELPTSRLSSARSNQLSYKPLSWRTAERARSSPIARRAQRARPRRKRNGDGGVPPMDIYDRSRSALMFPRDPIEMPEGTPEGSSLERR
jgi:hypothetical protein